MTKEELAEHNTKMKQKLETMKRDIQALLDTKYIFKYPKIKHCMPDFVEIESEDQGGWPVRSLTLTCADAYNLAMDLLRKIGYG